MKLVSSSIAGRVIFAFACVLVVVLALGLVAINRLGVVNDHAIKVRDTDLPKLAALKRVWPGYYRPDPVRLASR